LPYKKGGFAITPKVVAQMALIEIIDKNIKNGVR